MAATLEKPKRAQEVPDLDSVRPRMAKAVPRSPTTGLREVIERVLRQSGPIKAAAADMGIDRSQLRRQVESGHLTIERLEALGPEFSAELGRQLVEQYGPLSTPEARIRSNLRDIHRLLEEIAQFMEMVA